MNDRLDNYKINNKIIISPLQKSIDENIFKSNNFGKRDNLIDNNNIYLNNNKTKKNLIVKKKLEYDEEKEKKFVEKYYQIKNAELNKLRFGIE